MQYQQQPQNHYHQQAPQQYMPPSGGAYTGAAEPTFGQDARKGSNAYAQGGNQNCGNVLTDRPTSRVLAPPGGGSTFKLG